MIDLAARREANKRRLLGIENESGKTPYTKTDVGENPEICWDIISLCIRKATETTEDGKTKQTKKLKFPELLEPVEVGSRRTGKNAKKTNVTRTNLSTMEEMYKTRNSMNRHYEDDIDDKYVDYFKSVVEVLDAYAMEVVIDIVTNDGDFLNRVNAARGCSVKKAEEATE